MCFNIFLLPVISTRYLLAAVFMFNKWMFNIEKKDKEIPKTIEYGLKWMKIQKERNIPPKRSSKLLMTLDWYKYNINSLQYHKKRKFSENTISQLYKFEIIYVLK